MASQKSQYWEWTRCRGRNGWDAPQDIPADMAAEAVNVHFWEGGIAAKRGGATSVGTLTALTGPIRSLTSWVPGQNQAARELIAVDNGSPVVIGRMAGGSTFAALTLKDAISNPEQVTFASLNGKLFIAANTPVNRLTVFEPGVSTTTTRRAGMATPAAPAVANTGTGAYAAVVRSYRVAYTEQRSGVTVRRGQLGAAVTFTPSGTGTHARITKPAAITEGETHWEIYASADDAIYYGPIATVAVGTSTYDDNAVVDDYGLTYDLAPEEGANTPFPSVKYLWSDGHRLYGLGVWETSAGDSHAPRDGTVYFTPVIGTSSIADEERASNTTSTVGALLLSRNAGSVDRGLSALGNVIVAFQDRGVFALVPTGSAQIPFRRVTYSDTVGACSHWSIVQADDEAGRPAVYFLDPVKGPYRLGHDGFRWCGKDVADLWEGINPEWVTRCHGIYHAAKRQIWWWLVMGTDVAPSQMIVLDLTEQRLDEEGNLRGGWSKWTGSLAYTLCSTLMSNTLGASMSLDLKPYAGRDTGTAIWKADTTDATDNGTAFQASVTSGGMAVNPPVFNTAIVRAYLMAAAVSATTITQTLRRNFGDEASPRTSAVSLTPSSAGESHVLRKFEDAGLEDGFLVQVQLGDASASSAKWALDRWYGEVQTREPR